jgi:carbon starvation protein
VGIFAANPTIYFPAFTTFYDDKLGFLFPILFVTVACGAISGFHALVSSGTTAKQLDKETDALPIGYGSMLIEGLLAIIALVTVITILQGDYIQGMKEGGPIGLFASGIGNFVTHLGIPLQAGVTFAALAISAFALTTLDTATRLGRFMFQEIFEDAHKAKFLSKNRYVGTLVTIAFAMLLTFTGTREALWPLFGSANQLLASLTLLAVTVWLAKLKKKTGFVKYPMFFMFAVTLSALGFQIYNNYFGAKQNILLVVISLLLFIVAITLVANAITSLKQSTS